MGGIANELTSPFGVKLFKGGPYADAGAADAEQRNLDAYKAQIAPLISEIAKGAGVANPITGEAGVADPYSLSPFQQSEVNQQASVDTLNKDAIMSKVKANLAALGMAGSSEVTAAEAYLDQQLMAQHGSERIQAGQDAFQNRQNAMQQIAGLLSGQLGQQQQITAAGGQAAAAGKQNSLSQLGALAGLLFAPGGLFGSKQSPVIWNFGGNADNLTAGLGALGGVAGASRAAGTSGSNIDPGIPMPGRVPIPNSIYGG